MFSKGLDLKIVAGVNRILLFSTLERGWAEEVILKLRER
jgi:hypothetical protein